MIGLPQNWVNCTLSDLLKSLESGSRPKGGVKGILDGIPSLGGEHLTWDGKFDFSSIRYVPKQFALSMNKGHIKMNDILIVKDGATTGKTSFVDHSFPYPNAVVNEHVFICRPLELIDARYLFRFLMSEEGKQRILSNFQGSAQGGINLSFAPNTEIPLAPLNEQRRIVAKLDELLANVDACKARLDKIPTILKRFRQSVLAAACSGRLTADWREKKLDRVLHSVADIIATNEYDLEVPKSWKWRRLQDTGEVITGKTPPKKYPENFSQVPSELPFFKPTDLDAGYNVGKAREWISEKGKKYCRILPVGTVAVTCIGATIGKTGRLSVRGTTNQQINSVIPNQNVISGYLYFYFTSEYFQERIKEEASSTTLPIINKRRFERLECPLPPVEEQKEIVHRVEALFKLADQIEKRYQKAKAHVDKLTQSILAQAFRGELVPQDPNDEPAAKLLERIQAEREQSQNH